MHRICDSEFFADQPLRATQPLPKHVWSLRAFGGRSRRRPWYQRHMDIEASRLAVIAAGSFFLVGLVSGAWKYQCIHKSEDATAPVYVDITHRASLLYAFACLLIERFVHLSSLSPRVETAAVFAQVLFFGLPVGTYVIHGLLRDTDNQLAKPHKLGKGTVPSSLVTGFMWALMAGEIGGFGVLFWGAL